MDYEKMSKNRAWGHPRPPNDTPKSRGSFDSVTLATTLVMCLMCKDSEMVHPADGACVSLGCKCKGMVRDKSE